MSSSTPSLKVRFTLSRRGFWAVASAVVIACDAFSCNGLALVSTDSYRVLVMPPYAAEMDCSVTLYDPAGWLYFSRLTFTAFDTESGYDCKCAMQHVECTVSIRVNRWATAEGLAVSLLAFGDLPSCDRLRWRRF